MLLNKQEGIELRLLNSENQFSLVITSIKMNKYKIPLINRI